MTCCFVYMALTKNIAIANAHPGADTIVSVLPSKLCACFPKSLSFRLLATAAHRAYPLHSTFLSWGFFPVGYPSDLLLCCCHKHPDRNLVLSLKNVCPVCFTVILSSDRILDPRPQDLCVPSRQPMYSDDVPLHQPPGLSAVVARFSSARSHTFR